MIIYRSYAELVNSARQIKKVELLWDNHDEVMRYVYSLKDYSRCQMVEAYKMESTTDHVFKDVVCIARLYKNT